MARRRLAAKKDVWSGFQVLGAATMVVAVLTHVFEALHWFPWMQWMQWGQEDSIGHYVDLSSAVLGGTLFPVGLPALHGPRYDQRTIRLHRGHA